MELNVETQGASLMLQCQKNFIDYLEKMESLLEESDILYDRTLKDRISRTELLLPVIGAFSAGKSTLLNSLLERPVLPVGIAPETELATELRYSADPHLLAILHDGTEERWPIESLGELNKRSSRYSHLRLYLESQVLKKIAPLVLVDMPGYGSSLENHNKAISFYLPRGVHFIVVTSIEDGNITQSMIRCLDEVRTYHGDFSFILSKCNLRGQEQVDEVIGYISEQIKTIFGDSRSVVPVGDQGAIPLASALESIDPEQLFAALFLDLLKDQNLDLLGQINLAARVLKHGGSETAQAKRELEKALSKLLEQREEAEADIRSRYSRRLLDRCLKGVGRDLDDAIGELTALGASPSNRNGFSNALSEIIRTSLTSNIKHEVDAISTSMIDRLAADLSLTGAGQSSEILGMGPDWRINITDRVTSSLKQTTEVLSSWSDTLSANKDRGKMSEYVFKGVSTILAVTTKVISPVLELVVIFLPDILRFLNGSNAQEKVRDRLLSEVFPSIKAELRARLPAILDEQLGLMLSKLNDAFERQICQQRDIIAAYETRNSEREAHAKEREQALESLLSGINSLANQYLYGLSS